MNTQIYFTKVPFMDSLLNEILSRLKITGGKALLSSALAAQPFLHLSAQAWEAHHSRLWAQAAENPSL